jgi:hypothetical protein
LREKTFAYLRRPGAPQHLILIADWGFHTQNLYANDDPHPTEQSQRAMLRRAFDQVLSELAPTGKIVTVFGDTPPAQTDDISCLIGGGWILRSPCPRTIYSTPRSMVEAMSEGSNEIIRELPSRWNFVSVEIPEDAMCTASDCPTFMRGEYLYRDKGHLRRNLTPATKAELARMLGLEAVFARRPAGA